LCNGLQGLCGRSYKKSSVFEWHKWLKVGYKNVEDYARSGCQNSYRTDENVEKVWNLVHSGRHVSISEAYYVEIL
jgi:hypothetical protein